MSQESTDLSSLNTISQKTFRFLLKSDWLLLIEKSRMVSFARGDIIIQQGKSASGLYIIKDGSARIEQTRKGVRTILAQRGPGEFLGDMSFLENTEAMATVIAERDCQLYLVDVLQLQSLLNSVPGFSTRFYQSVAVHLSERLREAAELIALLRALPGFKDVIETGEKMAGEPLGERISHFPLG